MMDGLDRVRDHRRQQRRRPPIPGKRRWREFVGPSPEGAAALSARCPVTPQGPILIEMFPRHDDFAVLSLDCRA
jgi:hypothetical protein